MNRGDIYWASLDPTLGSEINKLRPCVLVGATPINRARRTVLVVPLSSSARSRPPIIIPVICIGKQVTAVCDQLRSIDKIRLKNKAGSLSSEDLSVLEESLRQVLCL
jgi:mRNA interferase MazF